MNWRDYIDVDGCGRLQAATIRGTNVRVDHLLQLLANGWSSERIVEEYLLLPAGAVAAACLFAAECVADHGGTAATRPFLRRAA